MKPLNNYPELLRLLEKYSPAGQNYAQLILEIEKKSSTSDMIVPILGTQGMGKSTMINAILGEDILPSEADETTCVPVEIRYGTEPQGIVRFRDDKAEVYVKTKADLSAFVDNNFNPGNEKQVSHIVLYRDDDLLKTGLVIVDLPGVGSLTKANEETTNRYIKDLCVAIFIISTSPPILKTEANFIASVWRSFNSVYFVQNVWDDNSREETEEGLTHNKKVLQEISQKINAPILHPIIPVNAYAAAKGSFEKDEELIRKSNINELVEALNSFAVSYRAESASALEARVMQLVASAGEQAVHQIQLAKMTSDEQLAALEDERKHFESVSYEVEESVGAIKRQLESDRREVQSFATATARKYSELLRVEIFRLVDRGVVDGELLSNAFSEYQSQYATDAMDEVYEKLATAPCAEDIGGALGSTGGKRHRRRENQHADHDVPLSCFKQQLDIVPSHDNCEDQDDQGHRSRCQAADNDRQHAREIRKLDRRKRSVNDPSVRRAGKLEDEGQDLVRKIGQEQKEDRPKEQFTGVLRTEADTCAIVLEQLPDQIEQDEPNSNRHEDVVHRLRSREIPKEYGHITA